MTDPNERGTGADDPRIAPFARRLPEDWIGAAAMMALALITFGNVIARYFTNESFAWTEEISISLMVVLTMVSSAAASARNRHIRIEFLYDAGSARRKLALALFSEAASILAFLMLFGLSLRLLWDDYRYEVTSPGIGVPQWWYTVWLPLLALLIAARSTQRFVRLMRTPPAS